jgi:hypothetical protein
MDRVVYLVARHDGCGSGWNDAVQYCWFGWHPSDRDPAVPGLVLLEGPEAYARSQAGRLASGSLLRGDIYDTYDSAVDALIDNKKWWA